MLEDCYNYPLDRVKRSWCQHKPKFSTPADQPVWPGDDRLPRGVRWRSAWLDRGEQIFGSKHNQRFLNILPAVNLTVENLWKNFPPLQFSRTLKDNIYCIFFNFFLNLFLLIQPDCENICLQNSRLPLQLVLPQVATNMGIVIRCYLGDFNMPLYLPYYLFCQESGWTSLTLPELSASWSKELVRRYLPATRLESHHGVRNKSRQPVKNRFY